jgi:hypothetical protein
MIILMAVKDLIPRIEALSDKIFNDKIFTPKVKKILIIALIAASSGFLLTIYTLLGIIFIILGIGLIMLLVEFIFILPLTIILLIRVFRKGKNNHVEIGLLIGILITILSIVKFFNPNSSNLNP